MKMHRLKLSFEFCDDVNTLKKPFEIRFNDRGFQTGDVIVFDPVVKDGNPTEHHIKRKPFVITYVLNGWGLKDNYVCLGIKPLCKWS